MADKSNDPLKGNLRGFLNRQKMPGDNRPVFQGKLSLPGIKGDRSFALWPYTSEKSGASVLSGRAGASAAEQIQMLTNPQREHDTDTTIEIAQKGGGEALHIQPNAIVMFTNKSKDADNQKRPDYFGYYNPGGGQPLMRLAAWTDTDRNGAAIITGNVSKDEPRRDMDAPEKPRREAPEPDHEEEEEHAM